MLTPACKDYLWGGDRLKKEYGKKTQLAPLAETWECSTHPDGLSIVRDGAYKGMTLKDVLSRHPEYIGTHPDVSEDRPGELPILVKLIDASKDLSVQVHPDDDYAYVNEGGSRGKTEGWYVLDASEDASLVYGFEFDLDPESIRRYAAEGRLEDCLHRIPVKKDDVFYIKAGTIHAIGAGTLIAEIQENSNITYRLYDYDRTDKNGNRRPLHMDRALDVACLDRMPDPVQPMRVLRYEPGVAKELLFRCRYFEVHRIMINASEEDAIPYRADELSFRVLLCIDGEGLAKGQDLSMVIKKGDCIFIPADSECLKMSGKLQLLDICG